MRRFLAPLLALLALLTWAAPALAVLPSEQLANPRLEARARHLGGELRCVVCQNQTIDDSDAPLAGDLRVLLRQRLLAGDSDKQAVDFIVARYGHYVLLKPPLEAQTLLLWWGPALVLAVGGIGIVLMARGSRNAPLAAEPLTPEEEAALARRLESDPI